MYLRWHSCDEMWRLADKNDRLDLTLPKNADGDVARHEVSMSVSVCACVCVRERERVVSVKT